MEKAFATVAVAWHTRAELLDGAKEYVKDSVRGAVETIRKMKPFILIMLIVAFFCVLGARVKWAHDTRIAEEQAEVMRLDLAKQEAIRASEIAAQQAKEAEAAAAHRAECEAVARVLYGTALHHSDDAQRAVVWCVLNRVDSSLYPDTIQAVCEQPQQWMGFSEENPIISSLYDIADEVITAWRNGEYRPMSPDYLYLSFSSTEITLRTTFTETRNTHYWRAG